MVSRGFSLVAVASLVEHRPGSEGARVKLLRAMWHLPGTGIEPVSPALASGFLVPEPPGKPSWEILISLASSPWVPTDLLCHRSLVGYS